MVAHTLTHMIYETIFPPEMLVFCSPRIQLLTILLPVLPLFCHRITTNALSNMIARDDKFDCARVFIPAAHPPSSPKSHKSAPTPPAATLSPSQEICGRIIPTPQFAFLKGVVGGVRATPAPLPTRPDAARSSQSSVRNDNSEHVSTRSYGAARPSSSVLPERLVRHARHLLPHEGGHDTARPPQHIPAHKNLEVPDRCLPSLRHITLQLSHPEYE